MCRGTVLSRLKKVYSKNCGTRGRNVISKHFNQKNIANCIYSSGKKGNISFAKSYRNIHFLVRHLGCALTVINNCFSYWDLFLHFYHECIHSLDNADASVIWEMSKWKLWVNYYQYTTYGHNQYFLY